MTAWYNEIDPYAAQWLRNLIKAGELPDGEVDERSIVDVFGRDLDGFDQCHFFAGIGVWAKAVADTERWANRRFQRPIWTGSPPCQPLSVAGQRKGHVDQRHLWPAFHRLIAERRPSVLFGEQVASKDGREWLAAVRHDLESVGYAVGAACLSACGVGAPHIRYRMFFMADAGDAGKLSGDESQHAERSPDGDHSPIDSGATGGVAESEHTERWPLDIDREDGCDGQDGGRAQAYGEPGTCSEVREVADAGHDDRARPPDSFWSDADWIFCRDGNWRPTQSIIFSLAHGTSPRLGRMRAMEEIDGNAGQRSAAAFLRGVREEIGEEAFFERIGGLLSLPRAEILRSSLYGVGNGERGLSEPQSQSVEGCQDGEARMRDVREGRANARSSHGREPKEQRAIELDDVMSFLSSTAASPLVDASAFKSGGPYEGISRTGMLRGYGNALVLPVARVFLEAAIEALYPS